MAETTLALARDAVAIQETLADCQLGSASLERYAIRLQSIDRMTQSLSDLGRALAALSTSVPAAAQVRLADLEDVLLLGALRSHIGTGQRETGGVAGEVLWL